MLHFFHSRVYHYQWVATDSLLTKISAEIRNGALPAFQDYRNPSPEEFKKKQLEQEKNHPISDLDLLMDYRETGRFSSILNWLESKLLCPRTTEVGTSTLQTTHSSQQQRLTNDSGASKLWFASETWYHSDKDNLYFRSHGKIVNISANDPNFKRLESILSHAVTERAIKRYDIESADERVNLMQEKIDKLTNKTPGISDLHKERIRKLLSEISPLKIIKGHGYYARPCNNQSGAEGFGFTLLELQLCFPHCYRQRSWWQWLRGEKELDLRPSVITDPSVQSLMSSGATNDIQDSPRARCEKQRWWVQTETKHDRYSSHRKDTEEQVEYHPLWASLFCVAGGVALCTGLCYGFNLKLMALLTNKITLSTVCMYTVIALIFIQQSFARTYHNLNTLKKAVMSSRCSETYSHSIAKTEKADHTQSYRAQRIGIQLRLHHSSNMPSDDEESLPNPKPSLKVSRALPQQATYQATDDGSGSDSDDSVKSCRTLCSQSKRSLSQQPTLVNFKSPKLIRKEDPRTSSSYDRKSHQNTVPYNTPVTSQSLASAKSQQQKFPRSTVTQYLREQNNTSKNSPPSPNSHNANSYLQQYEASLKTRKS